MPRLSRGPGLRDGCTEADEIRISIDVDLLVEDLAAAVDSARAGRATPGLWTGRQG